MPLPSKPPKSRRDGTSQAARAIAALDPAHVPVDGRTTRDWLAYLQGLAKKLRFYDINHPGLQLDWSGLFDGTTLDELAALADADISTGEPSGALAQRPHLALILAFLRLLKTTQSHLNGFSRRHLEYYYREVLQMREQDPVHDRVNVMFRPTAESTGVLVPAGTRVRAGKDADGHERVYRTTHNLVVNQAQIAQLRTIFTDQQVTGIREARERRDPGTDAADRFVRMFAYALGEPGPGGPLPEYENTVVDLELLQRLGAWVDAAGTQLYLELYELRVIWQLRARRVGADAEWAEINTLLENAGKTRTQTDSWQLNPSEPRNFDKNLEAAIGATPDETYFAGLAEVKNIDQLYALRARAVRDGNTVAAEEANNFIHDQLYFTNLEQFDRMMSLKSRSDQEWRDINHALELAGQRARDDRGFRLSGTDPTAFDQNLADAVTGLNGFSWPEGCAGFDAYYHEIEKIETYFRMAAEKYAYILSAAPGVEPPPPDRKWQRIYDILAEAYRTKVYQTRRAALADVRQLHGVDAMYYTVLGEPIGDGSDVPLNRVVTYVKRPADASVLQEVSSKIANDGIESIDATTWKHVYQISELAQRVREQLPLPVAEVVEWRNIYPLTDATTALVSLDLEGDNTPRWRTFGAKPEVLAASPPSQPTLGWAIASPLLAMAEGRRVVTLTLGFTPSSWHAETIQQLLADDALQIQLSGEKDWLDPSSLEVTLGTYGSLSGVAEPPDPDIPGLQLTMTFSVDVDPIVRLDPGISGISSDQPVIRILLRQRWREELSTYVIRYADVRDLFLAAVHVRTDVSELANLAISNDEVTLDPKKPFEPFGQRPLVGSRFYVSHPEIVDRQVDRIRCDVTWLGMASNLQSHYVNYPITEGDSPATNSSFKIDAKLIESRVTTATLMGASVFTSTTVGVELSDLASVTKNTAVVDPNAEVTTWNRYLQWELTPLDFQHDTYPEVAKEKALELTAAIANNQQVTASDYQVRAPYTPKVRSLTLMYSSSAEVILGQAKPALQAEQVYHIRPFGSHLIEAEVGESLPRFLPLYQNAGELYIGIQGVVAPQQLTILFQMAEGSADPNLPVQPVAWSYLSGDRWYSLHNGNILSDTTRGLINSGIIEFKLDKVAASTQMPSGLYWLRAEMPANTRSVCDTVAIHTQAVSATFVDQNNSPSHYERPLPPDSVAGLEEPIAQISEVLQPYTSFGGRPREAAQSFYTRVSERLRHKGRALTGWDYERLILQQFPEVYKAKALPADLERHPDRPGLVEIVIIPDMRGMFPFDPFEPKAPADLLTSIQEFVGNKSPAFAEVEVRNPHYVYVKARFGVRFMPGHDIGYYQARLNDELNRFLSPWGYDEGADIVFGNRIYATSILNFVDRLPYVDYVASIRLFQSTDGMDFKLVLPTQVGDSQGYYVSSDRPDTVLVAARQHDIDIISELSYEEQLHTGVNHMKIELDFVVG